MKNRFSMKFCQKNLLTEKNTMSWENIPASLTCGRAKMPSRPLALAAGATRIEFCYTRAGILDLYERDFQTDFPYHNK